MCECVEAVVVTVPSLPPEANPHDRRLDFDSAVRMVVCSFDITMSVTLRLGANVDEATVGDGGRIMTCSGNSRSFPSPKPNAALRFDPHVNKSAFMTGCFEDTVKPSRGFVPSTVEL